MSATMAERVIEYNQGLNAALLTLDEQTIRGFYRQWNDDELHSDPEIFWSSIHKCITGRKSLPIAFRIRSKQWLASHNLASLDDGELDAFLKNPVDGSELS